MYLIKNGELLFNLYLMVYHFKYQNNTRKNKIINNNIKMRISNNKYNNNKYKYQKH